MNKIDFKKTVLSKAKEKQVDHLNYLALGHGRDKFISSAPARWVLLIISFGVLILAIIGAIVSD